MTEAPESTPEEHGPRIFRNSQMTPDAHYRAECWCGWGDENDGRGQRYYATERAAQTALSIHATRRSA